MIRLEIKGKVLQLDEETFARREDYEWNDIDADYIIEEIERALTALHIIGEDGRVFVVRLEGGV